MRDASQKQHNGASGGANAAVDVSDTSEYTDEECDDDDEEGDVKMPTAGGDGGGKTNRQRNI